MPRFIDHDWATAGLLKGRPSVDDIGFLDLSGCRRGSPEVGAGARPSRHGLEPSSRPHHKIRRRGVLHDIRQPRCPGRARRRAGENFPGAGLESARSSALRGHCRSRLNCPRSRRDLIGHRCVVRGWTQRGSSTGDLKWHPRNERHPHIRVLGDDYRLRVEQLPR